MFNFIRIILILIVLIFLVAFSLRGKKFYRLITFITIFSLAFLWMYPIENAIIRFANPSEVIHYVYPKQTDVLIFNCADNFVVAKFEDGTFKGIEKDARGWKTFSPNMEFKGNHYLYEAMYYIYVVNDTTNNQTFVYAVAFNEQHRITTITDNVGSDFIATVDISNGGDGAFYTIVNNVQTDYIIEINGKIINPFDNKGVAGKPIYLLFPISIFAIIALLAKRRIESPKKYRPNKLH